MTSPRRFQQVDVFTDEPTFGNPVAVVLDSQGLTTEQMQRFTNWTNLSEATFVAPSSRSDADYSVRIFCPGRELPFAGHPTLGTCHAWLAAGGVPNGDEVVQECGVGLVRIRRGNDGSLSFAAPPLRRSGPLADEELRLLISGLGLAEKDVMDHQWCDNGPAWESLLLASTEVLHSVVPNADVLEGRDIGLVAPSDGDTEFEVRAFFPGNVGIAEDPVTGSLNAALAQWLIGTDQAPTSYRALQGTALGRRGIVQVEAIGDDIWVGGHSVTVIEGTVAPTSGSAMSQQA